MTTTQRGLLTLLKSAITGEKLSLPEGFRLEDADGIIRMQSLLPLAYQGAYHCGISPKTELMKRYQSQYYKYLMQSERQMAAVRQIYQAFEENGIDYMPLKGCNMKQLYPHPELRIMGDADILIRMEQYEKIEPLMKRLGYEAGVETQYELVWNRNDLHVELHKSLISPLEKEFYAFLGDGWDLAEKAEGCRYVLPPEDEFVFLFAHMTKHYRSSGIGSRQFLDLYLYRNTHPQLDEAQIEKDMDKIHLLEFYRNTLKLLKAWFENGPEDQNTELMTQHVLSGGNWGDYETYFQTQQVKSSKGGDQSVKIKGKALWNVVFLPLEEMQCSYKILYKMPYLCPVFWVIRWIRVILCSPGMIVKKLRMVNSLSDTKVNARREALNKVGLDFYDE